MYRFLTCPKCGSAAEYGNVDHTGHSKWKCTSCGLSDDDEIYFGVDLSEEMSTTITSTIILREDDEYESAAKRMKNYSLDNLNNTEEEI